MTRTHVIGAGMAGLACAVRLTHAGEPVTLYEAAPQAGGRCRSYHDEQLERTVDNGNHLLLSANRAALAFLDETGGRATLSAPPGASFPFVDVRDGTRWTLRPNRGPLPFWIFLPSRRVPGAGAGAHLASLYRALFGKEETVQARLGAPGSAIWERLWKPLSLSILNTEPEAASAELLRAVLAETLAKGGGKAKPLTPVKSLSHTFVEPALATLRRSGAELHLGARLRRFEGSAREITGLAFADGRVELGPGERVVLAVPPTVAGQLLPGLEGPKETRPIVNAHIRLPHRARLAEGIPFIGLVGGTAEWLFLRQDVASVTVSAARSLVDRPAEEIAQILWEDTARALALDPRLQPPMRVVKERRATFAQTPEALRYRPATQSRIANLLLAGDWTDTGLPATIEGAVRSGHSAAALVLRARGR